MSGDRRTFSVFRKTGVLKRFLEDPDERAAAGKVNVDDVDALVRHRRLVEHRSLVAQQALVDLGRVDRRLLLVRVLPGRAGAVGRPGVATVGASRNGPRYGQVLALRRGAGHAPDGFHLLRRLEVSVDHRSRRRSIPA